MVLVLFCVGCGSLVVGYFVYGLFCMCGWLFVPLVICCLQICYGGFGWFSSFGFGWWLLGGFGFCGVTCGYC